MLQHNDKATRTQVNKLTKEYAHSYRHVESKEKKTVISCKAGSVACFGGIPSMQNQPLQFQALENVVFLATIISQIK